MCVNSEAACQQNQKQERLIWSDKATELGIAAGCDTGWMSGPERLHQERRLASCRSVLPPDTQVEIMMLMLILPVLMRENALLSCERAALQSTPINAG